MPRFTSCLTEFLDSGAILAQGHEECWVAWGNALKSESLDPSQRGWHIFSPDFFLKTQKPWFTFHSFEKVKRRELIQNLESLAERPSFGWEQAVFSKFSQTFSELQNFFQTRVLKKAVPVVFDRSAIALQASHKAYLLAHLLETTIDSAVSVYGLWDGDTGWLGASPELLFKLNSSSQVETAAVAGTRITGTHLKGDSSSFPPLLEDPKEREEHQIVIDGIFQSLHSLGNVTVGSTRELHLPHLSHLYTPVLLELSKSAQAYNQFELFNTLVQKLHPTPALGAYPREEGQRWLQQQALLENRLRFGAPFGAIWENGVSQCLVGIRNIQWTQSEVLLGAGSGIISSSEVVREWQEIQGKLGAVKRMFHV